MPSRHPAPQQFATLLTSLYRGFDAVATWVTQLSWWKFFLFAALAVIAGSILQDELFSSAAEETVVRTERGARNGKPKPSIVFDDSGIHFNPRNKITQPGEPPEAPAAPAVPAEAAKAAKAAEAAGAAAAQAGHAAAKAGIAAATAAAKASGGIVRPGADGEVHIDLPPQIGEELSDAIEAAVDDAAEAKVTRYHKQASTWFRSFVYLLVLALFATKALVGGKKRAEALTQTANAAAERESMQRQLSEAKMQMMQAQVEPHFLFNTLASVEYLIETNPPRASAMQRSLIQYLRAVLPQMRENAVVTNLGREVDMVTAYLHLLKMRMEERLTVELHIPDDLRSAAFPPMMLQSMVENAIKHGLECKPEGGTLRISVAVSDHIVNKKLRVTVADNGVGFGVMPSDGTGLGLPTIRERLKLLHGEAGQLHITANVPHGVIAVIEVPYTTSR
ncbi:MAG: histidine kinase [Pseudomonadota bacterium]|nr:histidine kinase [Pseudomonadota bacterium]